MIQTSEGKWLREELAKTGLVRIYGIRTLPAGSGGSGRFSGVACSVKKTEDQAQKKGGWH